MKVILLKDVRGLGKEDAILEVKSGYARNFLLPSGAALEATRENLNSVKQRKKAQAAKAARELAEARELAGKLEGLKLRLEAKAGDGERLYGAVTASDVAEALQRAGHQVDRRGIRIDTPIKSVGEYEVPIRLYTDVNVTIRVEVVAKEK